MLLAISFLISTSCFAGTETLQLKLDRGQVLEVAIRKPERFSGRLPALMIFGGFEEAAKVLELIHPPAPMILASFDYPFEPPRRFEFPRSLSLLPQVKATIHGTLEGIEKLTRELRERSDVDPEKISLVGASFGAPFAMIAAGSDPSIQGLVIVHGFGDIPGTATERLSRSLSRRYPAWLAAPVAWLLVRAAWFYVDIPAPESAVTALRENQRVLIIQASEDSFIPAGSSETLWRGIDASRAKVKERRIMPGDHLQPGSDRLISDILKSVTAWMKKNNLL